MANSFDFQVRPLRRVEYDKLVELGVFEGERIELLDGQLVRMRPPGQVQQYGEGATLSPERYPDFELRVADVLPAAK